MCVFLCLEVHSVSQVRPHYEACMPMEIILVSCRPWDCNTVEAKLWWYRFVIPDLRQVGGNKGSSSLCYRASSRRTWATQDHVSNSSKKIQGLYRTPKMEIQWEQRMCQLTVSWQQSFASNQRPPDRFGATSSLPLGSLTSHMGFESAEWQLLQRPIGWDKSTWLKCAFFFSSIWVVRCAATGGWGNCRSHRNRRNRCRHGHWGKTFLRWLLQGHLCISRRQWQAPSALLAFSEANRHTGLPEILEQIRKAFKNLITFLCIACECECARVGLEYIRTQVWMEVRGQLLGVCSLLPPVVFWGLH